MMTHQPAIDRWNQTPPAVKASILAMLRDRLGRDPRPDDSLCDLYHCLRSLARLEPRDGHQTADPRGRAPGLDRLQRAAGERE